jgi:hypothetical protein
MKRVPISLVIGLLCCTGSVAGQEADMFRPPVDVVLRGHADVTAYSRDKATTYSVTFVNWYLKDVVYSRFESTSGTYFLKVPLSGGKGQLWSSGVSNPRLDGALRGTLTGQTCVEYAAMTPFAVEMQIIANLLKAPDSEKTVRANGDVVEVSWIHGAAERQFVFKNGALVQMKAGSRGFTGYFVDNTNPDPSRPNIPTRSVHRSFNGPQPLLEITATIESIQPVRDSASVLAKTGSAGLQQVVSK